MQESIEVGVRKLAEQKQALAVCTTSQANLACSDVSAKV